MSQSTNSLDTDPIVIVGMSRTPMGGFQGDFAGCTASELGANSIAAALKSAGIVGDKVDEVIMGCVLPAGQGQAPARQAALKAGIPNTIPCSTINKMCGSGMKAMMIAYDSLVAGTNDIVVAGGMESMTNAPYLLPKARSGMRLGHGEVKDHMFLDGLEDAYETGRLMGSFAEDTATKYQFTREVQDAFAIESLKRAQQACNDGSFEAEIAPVTIQTRKGEVTISVDEQPGKAMPEKIPHLKPAFAKDGTVTAANSSSISDGAAALVLTRQSIADKEGLKVIATIKAHASNAHEPAWFTTAPIKAMERAMDKAGWTKDDVDLWEINEAFAVVTLAAMHDLGLDHAKVNVHGGACALGHPIGASGARISVTLISALQKYGHTKGIASLCIGGGEATALAIELAS